MLSMVFLVVDNVQGVFYGVFCVIVRSLLMYVID